MVERINSIPRADTQIANSEKTHLWDIKLEDEIVINAKEEVQQILLENLQVTNKAINVYDEYKFLLEEDQRIEKFLETTSPDRDVYVAEIQKYFDTIQHIQDNAPFEIRMSMFLVECNELNQNLIIKCEQLIDRILRKVYDYIVEQSSSVSNEIRTIN